MPRYLTSKNKRCQVPGFHISRMPVWEGYMGDAIFKVPTPLMLDKIVTAMDGIYEQMAQLKAADTRGDVYEYLLSKIATAGVNGQFRTPRHIIRMMVDMMEPKADEIVCENWTTSLIRIRVA